MGGLLLLTAASVVLSIPHTYGDWAVACDNIRACDAVPLAGDGGEDGVIGGDNLVELRRAAGPTGQLTIDLYVQTVATSATIAVDDTDIATIALIPGEGDSHALIGGEAATRIARAMVGGKRLTAAVGARGADPLASYEISLVGAAAMLRFIDAMQGRAGTTTAIVARGNTSASSVPPAQPMPIIPWVRPTAAPPASIGPALEKAMIARADCDTGGSGGTTGIATYRLDSRATLALLPCGNGAYNFTSAPFVIIGGKGNPAQFDIDPQGTVELTNAGWDAEKGELSSFNKGRGPGDCGDSQTYIWDGTRFRLVDATAMDECRGSTDWLTVWRAQPVPVR